MAGPKSHYAVLNVSPDADASVIEAAYRALIKKYHPDKRPEEAAAREHSAAELNEAYSVLRNPSRRADYDAREKGRLYPLQTMAPVVAETPRRRLGWLLPVGGAIALAAASAVFLIPTDDKEPAPATVTPAPAPVTVAQTSPAAPIARAPEQPVERHTIAKAVAEFDRVQAAEGIQGAVAYSQQCFHAGDDSQTLQDFDFCIAFDEAASAFEARAAGEDRTDRFQPYNLSVRHMSAGRSLSSDMAWVSDRLETLRSTTDEVLKEHEAPPVIATATSEEPGSATAPPARPRHTSRRAKTHTAAASSEAHEEDFLEREGYIY